MISHFSGNEFFIIFVQSLQIYQIKELCNKSSKKFVILNSCILLQSKIIISPVYIMIFCSNFQIFYDIIVWSCQLKYVSKFKLIFKLKLGLESTSQNSYQATSKKIFRRSLKITFSRRDHTVIPHFHLCYFKSCPKEKRTLVAGKRDSNK